MVSVFFISGNRMADGCQVRTDLVGTSGDQMDFKERSVRKRFNRRIFGFDIPAVRNFFRINLNLIAAFILFQVAGDLLFLRNGSLYDTAVIFLNRTFL